MARTPEGKVKDRVVGVLKEYGAYYFFPVASGYGVAGLFDINVVYKGVPIGVETKPTAKEKPTALQTSNAIKANAAGSICLLIHCDNLVVLEDTLRRIDVEGVGISREIFWPADCIEACPGSKKT